MNCPRPGNLVKRNWSSGPELGFVFSVRVDLTPFKFDQFEEKIVVTTLDESGNIFVRPWLFFDEVVE